MHSAYYAVARCLSVRASVRPSVRLSVTRRYSVETAKHIIKVFFTVTQTILVFQYQKGWQYSDGDPLTGASNARGYEKSRFSTNISLYLGKDARSSHSYYGRRIGNRTQACEWYQFEWP